MTKRLLILEAFPNALKLMTQPVTHYENFPVASWLCPPALRPAIAAIYWFARTADDIADEGDASAATRLAELAAFRADLHAIAAGQAPSARWPSVFAPLQRVLDAEAAKGMDLPAVNYDEAGFRYALNEDAMATEKLAEGIRAFAVDAVKLEKMILAA